jgi:HEPN domain-containing protein
VTRKEEEQRLLKRSADFLKTAKYQTSQGFYDLATFSLEQALELFLKAKVLAEGVDFPRTHSVRTLLELLGQLVSENKKLVVRGTVEKYLLELGMLEDAYITSRYVMREFTEGEAKKLALAVEEIMRNVA